MMKELENKVAIVSGAGSVGKGIGNGKATAIVFARAGAKVMLVDNNYQAAEETRRIINEEGGICFSYKADVSYNKECLAIVETCMCAYGRIDILHNNVGIEIAGGMERITEETWDRTLDVNLKSMFLLCKHAIPIMVSQGGGVIINISSINSIRALPTFSPAYAVSKAGVNALTREIAVEYAKKGIRANAILPGMLNTPMVEASLTEDYGGDVHEMMRIRDNSCPMGKQGDAWDVAYTALFLASDRSKYITGAEIIVDGAQTCRI